MDDAGSPRKDKRGWMRFFKKAPYEGEDVEEGIISLAKEGHEQGVILDSEVEMIHNIFEFNDTDARDIMTHRKHIAALDANMTFREMIQYIEEENYSRYPVYQDDIDNIIGVVHIKDILKQFLKQDIMDKSIVEFKDMITEVPFIPETRNINTLFKGMQSKKTHMAIVVDEYGQTSGLVTMEDMIEEIMGDIEDEHDEEEKIIITEADGSYLMNGMAPLDEVCELLGIEDDEELEEFDTLNGFLVSLYDKIPADDETFQIEAFGCLFDVQSVENKMIKTVKVKKQDTDMRESN
ncbi:MAG: HlyC/CorC family transporter [Eubacterium sp.]|nr:HlyC/CorC family transporter [Eubacterium sp.]